MGEKMQRTILYYSLIFLLFLIPLSKVAGAENDTMDAVYLKVLLKQGATQALFRVQEGKYRLVDESTGITLTEVQPGQLWKIVKEGLVLRVAVEGDNFSGPFEGPLLLEQLGTADNIFSFNNTLYRDGLLITNEQNGLLIANRVNVENYLYGVVGKEIGNYAEMEALKAQAVVSRSYALVSKGKNQRYDVTADTSSQVYGGYEAEETPGFSNVKKAVDATRGEVICFDNKLIYAFFHANSGGYTEDAKNVWSGSFPYIKPVASPFDKWALDYPTQVQGWPANTYVWTKETTKSELEKKFPELGELENIKVSYLQEDGTPTDSHRATSLELIGSRGQKQYQRDAIRSVLDLRSTLFDLQTDSGLTIMDGSGSVTTTNSGKYLVAIAAGGSMSYLNGAENNYMVQGATEKRTVSKEFQKVTINGHGYGHGLGMSQWGARGMAREGYNYRQIIEHYYNQDRNDGRLMLQIYREQSNEN